MQGLDYGLGGLGGGFGFFGLGFFGSLGLPGRGGGFGFFDPFGRGGDLGF